MPKLKPEQTGWFTYGLFVVAVICYGLGISLPMFSLNKFFVFESSFTILSGIWVLTQEKEYLLATLLLLFSVVTPCIKFGLIYMAMTRTTGSLQQLVIAKRLMLIGKWSMADVFIIAVFASTIKFTGLATVSVHEGIVFFASSVLLSLWLNYSILKNYRLLPQKLN